MEEVILQAKNLTKKFNKLLVFDSINLDIKRGKIFGIIGISGSGKTTLLNTLVGFNRPTKGSVLFEGKRIDREISEVKRNFGFATQNNSFYSKLTIYENLKYFGTLYGLSRNTIELNIKRILPLLELDKQKNILAENLSGGMQKRLDLACALINYPKILILDEPTEDLDSKLRRDMIDLIKRINQTGTTIIITSHLLWDMEKLCDEIAILHNSKILKVGSIDELRELYTKNQEVYLEIASGNYDHILNNIGTENIEKIVKVATGIKIFTDNPERVMQEVFSLVDNSNDRIMEVEVRKPTLNEVFEQLTQA